MQELLRFSVVSSTDEEKRTLISRLVCESNLLMQRLVGKKHTKKASDLKKSSIANDKPSLDSVHLHFQTPNRQFTMIDFLHESQNINHLVMNASHYDLVVILLDAQKIPSEDTLRYFHLAQFLGLANIVICVNQIDQTGYSQQAFDAVKAQLFVESAETKDNMPAFIPISTLKGDNLAEPSKKMSWYQGDSLLRHLEEVTLPQRQHATRFAIQLALQGRYVGNLLQGQLNVGEQVGLGLSGTRTTIQSIERSGQEVSSLQAGQSAILTLSETFDLKCGDWIYRNPTPIFENYFCANLYWQGSNPFQEGQQFELRQGCLKTVCRVDELIGVIKIRNGRLVVSDQKKVEVNDLLQASLIVADPILLEDYRASKELGMLRLIDEKTGLTCAIGMLEA